MNRLLALPLHLPPLRLTMLAAICAVCLPLASQPTVEQLLDHYAKAGNKERYTLAKQLSDRFHQEDVFFTPPQPVSPDMPSDTLDALVFYGAVCHCFCNDDYLRLLDYAERALPLLEHHHPLYYNSVLSNIAKTHLNLGEIQEAIETAQRAERACRAINDYRELSRVYTTLSYISTNQKQGQDAVDYILKAIEANRLSGDTLIIHTLLGAACEAYFTQGDYLRSIDYGKQSVRAAHNRGSSPKVISTHLTQLGYAYYLADSLEAGKRVLLDAIKIETQSDYLAVTCQHLGFIYMKENNKAEAAKWFGKGLEHARQTGIRRDICNLMRNLADALRDTDPKESLRLLEEYVVLRDTVYNDDLQEKLSKASASFHNDQLRQENENTRRFSRIILFSLIGGMLLSAAVIAMLVYSVRTRMQTVRTMRKLQAARDTFFTNVTHELRTPLTVIIGMARRLHEKATALVSPPPTAEEGEEMGTGLTLIERNGQQLLTLVNQLLDIAKASAETGNLEWQRGNVVAFVSMMVETAQPVASAKGVAMAFRPQSSEVLTDFVPDYVQKIVGNLIYNALKFTPTGGEVAIATRTEKKWFVVEVTDNGCGITPGDLPHLFEPFFQGTNHTMAGTGVGLALVRQLVETMGGQIAVESEEGHGAAFTVRLPLRHQPGTAAISPQAALREALPESLVPDRDATTAPTLSDDKGRTRILVVEDNADVAYYIGHVLADHYDVDYAANGQQGLEMARQLLPDLIVTDIMMPDVDGLELCRHIRTDELTNHIPIVIITARATDDDRLTGIGAGADAYLYKPFRADELLLRVEKLLEQRRMLQQKFSRQLGITAEAEPAPAPAESIFERNVRQANEEFIARFDATVLRLLAEGDFCIERVATELCMSRSQLARKLRAVIDMTPAAYILDIRLREAKRLLAVTPPLTLLDIALRCGFTDHAHLTNTFRRKYGITPSQFMRLEG